MQDKYFHGPEYACSEKGSKLCLLGCKTTHKERFWSLSPCIKMSKSTLGIIVNQSLAHLVKPEAGSVHLLRICIQHLALVGWRK